MLERWPDRWLGILWGLSLVSLPLLLPLGMIARWRAIRLPDAPLPWEGEFGGRGQALRFAVLGESTAAGVGVADTGETIAARTACALSRLLDRGISWRAVGVTGAKLASLRAACADEVRSFEPDVVLVVVGVNDTTSLTTRWRWRRELRELAGELSGNPGIPVVFSQLPPMHRFTAVPQPLRLVLGLRAALLDRDIRRLSREERGIHYAAVSFAPRPEYLAVDGYHPSAAGYALWGEEMGAALARIVRRSPGSRRRAGKEPGAINPGRATRAG